MRCRKHIILLVVTCLAAAVAGAEPACRRFPVGEKLTYKIYWGLLPCGKTTMSCEMVEVDGEDLIRIRATARSNWLISRLYPVNDVVDCYIQPATQLSMNLLKNTSEGGFICKDTLSFDRVHNTAQWTSESANISTNYPIDEGTCDAVSFLYRLRSYKFDDRQSRYFRLAVDNLLHGITVTAEGCAPHRAGALGKVHCRKFVTVPDRPDLFVRKIPEEIWVTDDDRRIMVRMTARIPVGRVRVVLDEYQPPVTITTGN